MATVQAFIVAAGCGLALLGAVSAHAGLTRNGLSRNGLSVNGLSKNGLSRNGLTRNGLTRNGLSSNGFSNQGRFIQARRHEGPTSAVQSESLPFNRLSQKGLGKTHP